MRNKSWFTAFFSATYYKYYESFRFFVFSYPVATLHLAFCALQDTARAKLLTSIGYSLRIPVMQYLAEMYS